MNTVRLVFGWLFLAGFTAAGTYYAMDEVDQRVGLARFQLHEKFGLVRAAGPQVNPSPVSPIVPNLVTPPKQQPVTPPPSQPTQPVTPPPYQPPPYQPPTQPVQPPTNPVQPPNQRIIPPSTNPTPVPYQAPQQPPQQPPQQRQRPADFTETNIRLTELQGQATRLHSTISRMRTAYGTARLDEPMSNLTGFLRRAEGALSGGDTASARRYMDQADIQVAKLKELLDQ